MLKLGSLSISNGLGCSVRYLESALLLLLVLDVQHGLVNSGEVIIGIIACDKRWFVFKVSAQQCAVMDIGWLG